MINNTYGVSVVMEFSKQTDFSMEKKITGAQNIQINKRKRKFNLTTQNTFRNYKIFPNIFV